MEPKFFIQEKPESSDDASIEESFELGILLHLSILILMSVWVIGCAPEKGYRISEERRNTLFLEIEQARLMDVEPIPTNISSEYQNFLERYVDLDTDIKSQALIRLGDLYLKESHEQFLMDMEAYERHPNGPPPQVNARKAIQTYQDLLRSFPEYPNTDEVLYSLSRAYTESGERDRGMDVLKKLIRQYPDSPYHIESNFRLGEYYFDRRYYEEAAYAYEKALQREDPFFFDKALYKLGWTYFILSSHQKAVGTFLELVDQKAEGEDFSPDKGSLVWEALTYVAASFRELGGPSRAAAYFKENGSRSYEKDLYLMMGNQYLSLGSPNRGIETYRIFLNQHPLHSMAPVFLSYILETYNKQNQREEAHRAQVEMVESFSSKSDWFGANDEKARRLSKDLVRKELHHLAISTHAKAKKNKKDGDFQQTATWYRKYISEFPEDHTTPELHFYLADVLMDLKNYEEAGAAYEVAAYGYSRSGVNQKSAYNAVVAYGKVETLQGDEKVIELSQRYAVHFPKDPRSGSVLMKTAELLFDRQRDENGRKILETVLKNYPTGKHAKKAYPLMAHSFLRNGKYPQAADAYRNALLHLPDSALKEKKEMKDWLATALYKSAELNKQKNEKGLAALKLSRIPDEAPESPIAAEALFEAGTLFESINQNHLALATYKNLIQKYPKSPLVGKAHLQLGSLYEETGQPVLAAGFFETAARWNSDPGQSAALLWKAGTLYEKSSRWDKAFTVFQQFSERYPKHADYVEGLYKMAEAQRKGKNGKKTLPLYQKVAALAPDSYWGAQALFQMGEASFREFKKITLKEPLQTYFKMKTQALEKVLQYYTQTMETEFSEVVTVSAYRLGEAFEHYQASLLSSEQPKNLNEEQFAEYRFLLEEKAFPFEEKAVQAYRGNILRLQNNPEVYDPWIQKSIQRLAELRPTLYKRPEREERIVSLIHPENVPFKNPLEHKTRMAKVNP